MAATASGPQRPGGSSTQLFVEEQRFAGPWIWPLILLATGFAWYALIRDVWFADPIDHSSGASPSDAIILRIVLLVIGIGLPLLFAVFRMRVTVHPDRVRIRMIPFGGKTIAAADITKCYAREYRPIREYGGWGIRYSMRHGWAYNVSGKQGVQLELGSGKKVLIGTQEPRQLEAAIRRMLGD